MPHHVCIWGCGADFSMDDNIAAYNRIRLRPRVCIDVSQVDLSTKCFGTKVKKQM